MRNLSAFISGLVFGLGLAISGMTIPAKVIGFLDFFGDWDPTLSFVMGGAVLVHMTTRRWVLAHGVKEPGLITWQVDRRLVVGSALFGIGWGMAGWCPGPAIATLGTMTPDILIFIAAMGAGMVGWNEFQSRFPTVR